jgi:hypothetical protein
MCQTVSLGYTLADGDNFSDTYSGDINTTITTTTTTTTTNTKTKCQGRKKLEACLEQLPPILDQAEMTGIPSSKKDVEASCRWSKHIQFCSILTMLTSYVNVKIIPWITRLMDLSRNSIFKDKSLRFGNSLASSSQDKNKVKSYAAGQ